MAWRLPRVRITGVPYHTQLLETADGFLHDLDYDAAIVFAHLFEAFDELLPNYNPGNPRVRLLYERVSGAELASQSFRIDFQNHVTKRNRIIHRGEVATEADALQSLAAVRALVGFLESDLHRRPAHWGPD